MNDLVDRKDVLHEVSRWAGYLDDDMIRRIQIGMKRLPSVQLGILEITQCKECIRKDKCNFYPMQGDEGYCRYGKDKQGRLNPQK